MSRKRLTVPEAADILGLHPMTVRRWIAEGRLPAHRIGQRLIRIWSDDLEKLGDPMGGAA